MFLVHTPRVMNVGIDFSNIVKISGGYIRTQASKSSADATYEERSVCILLEDGYEIRERKSDLHIRHLLILI